MDITSTEDEKSSKRPQRLSAQHLDAKLAAAFQSDCENLLQQFKNRQNNSFTTFTQVWREMCFLAIFEGLDNILTLKAFIENAFFTAKRYLHSSDIHIQTGALYVLYGLYYKQPINKWVKVRLTQADLEKLNEIIHIHKSSNSLEPVFIFSKMRLDGAFQYCALPLPLALEAKFLKRVNVPTEEPTMDFSNASVLSKFKSLMEEDPDLVQFEETDDEYQKLSQKYKDQLYIFPSKVGADLKRTYSETFQVALDEGSKDEDEDEHIHQTKTKAMANTNAIYRGERKVVTALDLTPSTSFNS